MTSARQPAQLEIECLKVLWKRAEATTAQVRAAMPRPLAYTTVMTVLDRMCAKGLVTRHKRGRSWAYAAALDLDTARAHAVRRLLANLFDHDSRALANYVLSSASAMRKVAPSIDDTLL
jgi:predicted transcriptional regulator